MDLAIWYYVSYVTHATHVAFPFISGANPQTSHSDTISTFNPSLASFQANGHFMFASEYAPMGDLTSNVPSDRGIGETCSKRVTRQIGSALEWVHR